jgi:hypothetical protein
MVGSICKRLSSTVLAKPISSRTILSQPLAAGVPPAVEPGVSPGGNGLDKRRIGPRLVPQAQRLDIVKMIELFMPQNPSLPLGLLLLYLEGGTPENVPCCSFG